MLSLGIERIPRGQLSVTHDCNVRARPRGGPPPNPFSSSPAQAVHLGPVAMNKLGVPHDVDSAFDLIGQAS